jgi:hypothetical protein
MMNEIIISNRYNERVRNCRKFSISLYEYLFRRVSVANKWKLSVIITQGSENKLKIIRQIFENLLPGNRHESPEGSSCIRHDISTKENFIFNFYTIFLIYTYSYDSKRRRCQIAARIEGFKILSTKLQRAVSLGLNNLM